MGLRTTMWISCTAGAASGKNAVCTYVDASIYVIYKEPFPRTTGARLTVAIKAAHGQGFLQEKKKK